ncbi:hypothetical protein BE20_28420 [Sorangium cellulosum]|nr:hypothetical protein BE20_28420 [Sorangium cellulosum]
MASGARMWNRSPGASSSATIRGYRRHISLSKSSAIKLPAGARSWSDANVAASLSSAMKAATPTNTIPSRRIGPSTRSTDARSSVVRSAASQ